MLCQDCKPAPTGVGLPAPEQECVATHTAWESFGSSVTLAQCLGSRSSLWSGGHNRPGSIAQRGSAVWVQRHAA